MDGGEIGEWMRDKGRKLFVGSGKRTDISQTANTTFFFSDEGGARNGIIGSGCCRLRDLSQTTGSRCRDGAKPIRT